MTRRIMQIRRINQSQFLRFALTIVLVVTATLILLEEYSSGSIANCSMYSDLSCRSFLRRTVRQTNSFLRSHREKWVTPLT